MSAPLQFLVTTVSIAVLWLPTMYALEFIARDLNFYNMMFKSISPLLSLAILICISVVLIRKH
jgi:hypothetical protein